MGIASPSFLYAAFGGKEEAVPPGAFDYYVKNEGDLIWGAAIVTPIPPLRPSKPS